MTLVLAALMSAIALSAYLLGDNPPGLIVTGILGAWLLLLSWFDLDHFRLPDWLTLPLIIAGLIYQYMNRGDVLLAAMGAMLGYALVWGLAVVWRRSKGVEAIGMGDAKLLAAAGAWLGVLALPLVLLLASGTGLIYALIYRAVAQNDMTAIPFGPFIGLGMWVMWLFPESLILLGN